MARFVACKWDVSSSRWDIIIRERSAAVLAERAKRWMDDTPPTFPPTVVGFARVPPGADVEQFVSTLPAPGNQFDDCPLCRAGSAHTIH